MRDTSRIRVLAIAIVKNPRGQILLHEGCDSVKNETFYRPLGGGVEFGETGAIALVREFEEEISVQLRNVKLLGVFENIFTYEGRPGHEVVLLYSGDIEGELRDSYDIVEGGVVCGRAVWRSVDEIRAQGAKLYPTGIDAHV